MRPIISTAFGGACGWAFLAIVFGAVHFFFEFLGGDGSLNQFNQFVLCSIFAAIPLAFLLSFVAIFVVWPVTRMLDSKSSTRQGFRRAGTWGGVGIGSLILAMIFIPGYPILFDFGTLFLVIIAPLFASILTGFITGDHLWKTRPLTTPEP